jgi:hypothetical protein
MEVVLDESTLTDITDSVADGKLVWTAPTDYADYALFAIYEQFTNQRSTIGVTDPSGPIANGSWVTDHFSAAGAALVTSFWDEHILDDHVKDLLRSVGKHSKLLGPRSHCFVCTVNQPRRLGG